MGGWRHDVANRCRLAGFGCTHGVAAGGFVGLVGACGEARPGGVGTTHQRKAGSVPVDNVITIVGNVADDPELRYTPSGVAVANVRVAVNQRFFNRDTNAWDERLDGFFTCNIWRDMAENVAESVKKGARVVVCGRLKSRSFEDKDGNTRWVTEIEADEIAPSLRFAKATVERAGGGGQTKPQEARQWGVPAAAPEPDDVPF